MPRFLGLVIGFSLLGATHASAVCLTPAGPGLNGFDVTAYGAQGDGTGDDTEEIQCAIDAAESYTKPPNTRRGAQVYFPAGVYLVSSTLNVRWHYVSLVGQGGAYTTTIKRAAGFTSGDTIRVVNGSDPNSLIFGNSISDVRLVASSDTTSGDHLHLINCARASYSNLMLDEQFGGLHLEGGFGLTFSDVDIFSDTYFSGVKAGSYLIKIDPGTHEATHRTATDINFIGGNWRSSRGNEDARVEYGLRIHSSDAMYFTNVHVLGGAYADVLIEPGNTDAQVSGLRFSNCWFDPPGKYAAAAVLIQGQTTKPFGLFTFDDCMLWGGGGGASPTQVADRGILVYTANLVGMLVSDSTIHGFGSHGVHVEAGSNVMLSGNQISNNNARGVWGAGIMIQAGVSDFQILDNVIGPNLATFTSKHSAGIAIPAGSSNRYSIVGNVVLNLAPGGTAIIDGGAGPTKLVSNNLTQ